MENVVLVFGGDSPESEVSIITAMQAAAHLEKEGRRVFAVYYKNGNFWLGKTFQVSEYVDFEQKNAKRVVFSDGKMYKIGKRLKRAGIDVDCVVNCCHGGDGENGTLAGYFEIAGVCCTSTGVLSAALSMDKRFSKQLFSAMGFSVADGVLARKSDLLSKLDKAEKEIGYPLVVKPNDLGSSIGISVVNDFEQAKAAAELAFEFSDVIVVEKCLENFTEFAVAVAETADGDIIVSPVEKPVFNGKIFDFEHKYLTGGKGGLEDAGREFPANISETIAQNVQSAAKRIYAEFGFAGVVRVDFMLSDGKLYIGEVNSIPGSLSCYLMEGAGVEFSELLNRIILAAKSRFLQKRTLKNTYKSEILKGFNITK